MQKPRILRNLGCRCRRNLVIYAARENRAGSAADAARSCYFFSLFFFPGPGWGARVLFVLAPFGGLGVGRRPESRVEGFRIVKKDVFDKSVRFVEAKRRVLQGRASMTDEV